MTMSLGRRCCERSLLLTVGVLAFVLGEEKNYFGPRGLRCELYGKQGGS